MTEAFPFTSFHRSRCRCQVKPRAETCELVLRNFDTGSCNRATKTDTSSDRLRPLFLSRDHWPTSPSSRLCRRVRRRACTRAPPRIPINNKGAPILNLRACVDAIKRADTSRATCYSDACGHCEKTFLYYRDMAGAKQRQCTEFFVNQIFPFVSFLGLKIFGETFGTYRVNRFWIKRNSFYLGSNNNYKLDWHFSYN